MVALNLGGQPYAITLSSLGTSGRVVLSTHLGRESASAEDLISVRANEGVIIGLS